MPPSRVALIALALLLGFPREDQTSGVSSATYAVSVLPAAPSDAARLSQTLLSFSIEQDRWPEWIVDGDSPNGFFLNALDNIAQLTGAPPWIRIGADSSDRTNFNAAVQVRGHNVCTRNLWLTSAMSETALGRCVSPILGSHAVPGGNEHHYWAGILHPRIAFAAGYVRVYSCCYFRLTCGVFHIDTQVIWGVNFGGNNMTALHLGAAAIGGAFQSQDMKSSGVALQAIEVGNEADLYANHGRRSKPYAISQYVKQCVAFPGCELLMLSDVADGRLLLQAHLRRSAMRSVPRLPYKRYRLRSPRTRARAFLLSLLSRTVC
jgi:hypothetical protein